MLSLSQVSKRFGGLQVLQEVSFDIPKGKILGLIGPNGAGKTTVLNLITGLLTPSDGRIRFNDRDLVGLAPHQITEIGIARTFQNIRVFKELTLLENVMAGMHLHLDYSVVNLFLKSPRFYQTELRARAKALELLSWVKLERYADMPADNLSYGDQRRLEFARALATEPKLLLLDEPVAGMNAAEKSEMMAEIVNIRDRGYSILLIEHDMRFIMGVCDRIVVLNFGKVIAQGVPTEIQNNSQVIEAYLGKENED
jgi:branched-chain amino acid transport system ATP-binding protein